MKTRPFGWGWLTLSLGALTLITTYFAGDYALFCWGWTLCAASVAWWALCKLPLGLTQMLLVGASILNAAAGVSNGLVMSANGGRMPVEENVDIGNPPAFLDAPGDRPGRICRMLTDADDSITPRNDENVHFDVPITRILRGKPVRKETPSLALLDDRHAIRICGEYTTYSKGDMMGFIGTVLLGVPGTMLLILGFLWRKLFRKRRAPA